MRPHPSANLLDTARAATARWPLVLLVTVAVAGGALVASTKAGKSYEAEVELVSSDEGPAGSVLGPTAAITPAALERNIATDAELITAGGTAHAAQRALGLGLSADDLLEHIEATPDPASDLLTLTARDQDPKIAAAIANAFADAYVNFRVASARQPYVEAEQLAAKQLSGMTAEELASTNGVALEARFRPAAYASRAARPCRSTRHAHDRG